jgi:hypothetical protein
VEATPHGSFRLEIFAWDFVQNRFAEAPALSMFLSAAELRPGGGNLSKGRLYYSKFDAEGKRTFEALFDVAGEKYLFRIRLTDPLNRSSERMVSGQILENDAADLKKLKARRAKRDLFISFESATRVSKPPFGEYRLDITFIPTTSHVGIRLLLTIALHQIGVGDLNNLKASPVTTILREAKTSRNAPCRYGAVIKNFYSSSIVPIARPGILRVRITAPDGTLAQLELRI